MTSRYVKLRVPSKLHEPQRVRAEEMRSLWYLKPCSLARESTRSKSSNIACSLYQRTKASAAPVLSGICQPESCTIKNQGGTLAWNDGERVGLTQVKEFLAFHIVFRGFGLGVADFGLIFLDPFGVRFDEGAGIAHLSHFQRGAHCQIAVAFDDESNCLPAGPYQPVNGYGHAEIVTERRLQGCEENGDWQY